jgi:hypothetical protein
MVRRTAHGPAGTLAQRRTGQLPELLDVMIKEKASLFVCAVGVPPKFAVDRLHAAGIPIMNVGVWRYDWLGACAECAATDGWAPEACSWRLMRVWHGMLMPFSTGREGTRGRRRPHLPAGR